MEKPVIMRKIWKKNLFPLSIASILSSKYSNEFSHFLISNFKSHVELYLFGLSEESFFS